MVHFLFKNKYQALLSGILFATVLLAPKPSYAITCAVEAENVSINLYWSGNAWYWKDQNTISDSAEECKYQLVPNSSGVSPIPSDEFASSGNNSVYTHIPRLLQGRYSNEDIKNRSEFVVTKKVPLNDDHWYKFSVYFPKNFQTPDSWFSFSQIWQYWAGTPPLAFEVKDNRILIRYRNDDTKSNQIGEVAYFDPQDLQKGLWITFLTHFKGGLHQDGFLKIWKKSNDKCFTEIVNAENINLGKSKFADGSPIPDGSHEIAIKFGIYRGASALAAKLYFDDIVYTDTDFLQAEVEELSCK